MSSPEPPLRWDAVLQMVAGTHAERLVMYYADKGVRSRVYPSGVAEDAIHIHRASDGENFVLFRRLAVETLAFKQWIDSSFVRHVATRIFFLADKLAQTKEVSWANGARTLRKACEQSYLPLIRCTTRSTPFSLAMFCVQELVTMLVQEGPPPGPVRLMCSPKSLERWLTVSHKFTTFAVDPSPTSLPQVTPAVLLSCLVYRSHAPKTCTSFTPSSTSGRFTPSH